MALMRTCNSEIDCGASFLENCLVYSIGNIDRSIAIVSLVYASNKNTGQRKF
jgi:hypothetical protein